MKDRHVLARVSGLALPARIPLAECSKCALRREHTPRRYGHAQYVRWPSRKAPPQPRHNTILYVNTVQEVP